MSSLMSQARVRVPRLAEEAVERARLVVVPRQRRRSAPRVPFAILVGLVLLGGVAGLLLFNTHMQKGSFTATALQEQSDILDAREQQLRMELDAMRDPQRLAERARSMGMVPRGAPIFLRLSDGSVTGAPMPPTVEDDFAIGAPAARKPA